MAQNTARWEEGTEITLDATVEAPAPGWTLNHTNVLRIGALVAVHIEAAFAGSAAALVTTLQSEFRPADTVTTADGKFTIAADGKVSFTGSTTGGGAATAEAVYQAGATSP